MATSGGDAVKTDSDFLKELLQKGIKEKSIEHLTKHDVDSKEALCAVDIDELKVKLQHTKMIPVAENCLFYLGIPIKLTKILKNSGFEHFSVSVSTRKV